MCRSSGVQMMLSYPLLNNRGTSRWMRITEWLQLDRTSGGHPQAGPPRACCPGLCPDSFWLSARVEASQSPWAACCTIWSLSQGKSVSQYSEGALCVSGFCAYCLLILLLGATEKGLALPFLHHPFRHLHTLMNFAPEPSLLQTQWS